MKHIFLHILLPWRKRVVDFSFNWNYLMQWKTNFFFILTDNHTSICEIICSDIRNRVLNNWIGDNIM